MMNPYPYCLIYMIWAIVVMRAGNVTSASGQDEDDPSSVAYDIIESLQGYNSMLRPNFGGSPVAISVDLIIEVVGPVSSDSSSVAVQAAVVQTWVDERILINNTITNDVRYDREISTLLWTPDTYISTVGSAVMLKGTEKRNGMVTMKSNGEVSLATRVHTDIPCMMVMDCYPFDVLTCEMKLGSWSYTTEDAIYYNTKFIYLTDALTTSAFSNYKQVILNGSTKQAYPDSPVSSYISMKVYLERKVGIFIFKAYMPCVLIVIVSWINFWISRAAVPARAAIGITTVLTMTTITSSTMEMVPDATQLTPVDQYVGISFIYVVAALIEFAVVQFYNKGRQKFNMQTGLDVESNGKKRVKKGFSYYLCCCTPLSCARHGWHCSNRLDQLSRIIFPVSYIVYNFIYWAELYLKSRKTYYQEETDLTEIISVWDNI